MMRLVMTLASAAIGLAFALLGAVAADRAHLLPHFPAFAGEDDFTLRAEVYFFVVCPAFVVLGGALGFSQKGGWRSTVRSWLGVAAGSVVAVLLLWALGNVIEHLSTRSLANLAAIAFLVAWPVLATLGAMLVRRIWSHNRAP